MASSKQSALAALAVLAVVAGGTAAGFAADKEQLIKDRQAHMKAQGKDLFAVKGFLDGKSDLAAARAAGADLVKLIGKVPGLFPKGTSTADFPGKSYAKPAIWTEPDKFAAAAKNAAAKAEALDTALKGGDKAAIAAAFGGMIKGGLFDAGNGCGGCHVPFREKKPS